MENLLKKIEAHPSHKTALRLASHAATVLSVVAFAFLALTAAKESVLCLAEMLTMLGVPFLAVSFLRRAINAPRPYEIYDFYGEVPKKKRGHSFPSRHAHSVFAIGTALCFESPLLGGILLLIGAVLCAARVLLGIHFIRDVLTGALTGTVTTLLGKLIFSLI